MKLLKYILPPEITIVTVVFKKELPLLYLQAKSIKKFLNVNLKKIFIIVNDKLSKDEKISLNSSYNEIIGGKINFEIITSDKLINKEHLSSTPGWKSQQILKLKIHKLISTSHYLTLDAKNHLIRELKNKDLFTNKKPIAYVKYNYGDYWKNYISDSRKVLKISNGKRINYFIPPSTPYMLITEEVKNLSNHLRSNNSSIMDAILNRGATEYLLYYLYLTIDNKAKKLYSFKNNNNKNTITFFTEAPSSKEELDKNLKLLHIDKTKWLAIHRNRFLHTYKVDVKKNIIETWEHSGLFESLESAENFWDSFKETLQNTHKLEQTSPKPIEVQKSKKNT